MYVYWLCGDKCMYICCVETSVCILVVWRQVYGLWLCGDKCMDIGCVEVSVWILVVLR